MSTATIEEAIANTVSETEGKKPVKTFRYRALSVSVFENATKEGKRVFHSATPQRAYRVGDEFRHSSSFTRDDLPIVEHLLKQAWQFILEEEAKGNDDTAE